MQNQSTNHKITIVTSQKNKKLTCFKSISLGFVPKSKLGMLHKNINKLFLTMKWNNVKCLNNVLK